MERYRVDREYLVLVAVIWIRLSVAFEGEIQPVYGSVCFIYSRELATYDESFSSTY